MNNRGQALVEFIIILPILLLLILGAIDFGNILHKKYILENDLDYVVELVEQNNTSEINSYLNKKQITSNIETSKRYVRISLKKKIEIITPGLNRILGNFYEIEANRVIVNEE